MTKSEFLAQENVPEFIKAIVSSGIVSWAFFTQQPLPSPFVCITVVLICLIGGVCDVIKKKGRKDNERKNDDSL